MEKPPTELEFNVRYRAVSADDFNDGFYWLCSREEKASHFTEAKVTELIPGNSIVKID